MNIFVDCPEQDDSRFSIPVLVSKKNKINVQGLETSNWTIENLTFIRIYSTMNKNNEWHPLSHRKNHIEGYHEHAF